VAFPDGLLQFFCSCWGDRALAWVCNTFGNQESTVAFIQKKGESFYCQFLYLGRRYTVTVGPVSKEEAEAFRGKVEYLLLRIRQGFIVCPPGVPITEFIRADGQVKAPEEIITAATEPVTFGQLKDRYLETHRNGSMEENSLATVRMHLNHFEGTFGEKFLLQQLQLADLQRHINERSRKKYRGKNLSPVTLKKEVASFRAAWNWAVLNGLVKGNFPSKGLVYPKTDEKPPSMTWAEIERKLSGLSEREREDLWDCLFLQHPEVAELLAVVQGAGTLPWVYPAICFAAHTGARRSEIIRVRLQDLDLEAGHDLIREKKRVRGTRTHRRVPLSPFLVSVLQDWLKAHPGGSFLFCQAGEVARSKKRSRKRYRHSFPTSSRQPSGRCSSRCLGTPLRTGGKVNQAYDAASLTTRCPPGVFIQSSNSADFQLPAMETSSTLDRGPSSRETPAGLLWTVRLVIPAPNPSRRKQRGGQLDGVPGDDSDLHPEQPPAVPHRIPFDPDFGSPPVEDL
jgi:integrase